jgi:hypothetical protein
MELRTPNLSCKNLEEDIGKIIVNDEGQRHQSSKRGNTIGALSADGRELIIESLTCVDSVYEVCLEAKFQGHQIELVK